MITVNWTKMKSILDAGSNFEYTETPNGNITITARDNSVIFTCLLSVESPRNAEEADFTDNYSALATDILSQGTPAFASKKVNGKDIYKRVTGKAFSVSAGSQNLDFTIPYPQCKITGIELVNTEVGDFVDFEVLDTAAGTVSGIPNLKINQFGFTVYLTPGSYKQESNYDANLFAGLTIRVVYNSQSAKDVYVNYILHEIK